MSYLGPSVFSSSRKSKHKSKNNSAGRRPKVVPVNLACSQMQGNAMKSDVCQCQKNHMAFSLQNWFYFHFFMFVYLRKRRGPSTTHTEFGNKNGGAKKHMNHAGKQPHPRPKNKDMRCYRMRAWLGSKYLSFNNVLSHPHFCYRIL